ncbi:MAG: hypothetical protein LR015_12160 [Verrucomicrobia bacterium]|nr:hypothetical protein [Verrucomicrobiota bacterium]
MTPSIRIKKRIALVGALISAFALSAVTSVSANWTAIDVFSDGSGVSSAWVNRGAGINLQVVDGVLQVRNAGNTSSATIPLPNVGNARKFTIAFDFFLPVGPTRLNEVGFGVASTRSATGSGWVPAGGVNRFQTANTAPQQLVRATNWGEDVLAPTTGSTQQGIWYNIWVVYDLDAGSEGTVSLWAVTERDEGLPAQPNFSRA